MKKLLLLLILLLGSKSVQAQNFFETSWKYGNTQYTGLLIFYDDNDALMRISYTKNNLKKVAEYKCYGKYFEGNGLEGYLLDGKNGKLVYGATGSYSADNFIFVKSGNAYGVPMIIDDSGLKSDDPKSKMIKLDYWKQVAPSSFTASYIQNFFQKSDVLYNQLVTLSEAQATPVNHTQPSNSTGNNTTNTYTISEMAHGGNNWTVIMSANTGFTQQQITLSDDFPRDFVRNKWDEGYYLTSLACTNGEWAAVMSEGTGFSLQSWRKDANFPSEWINEKWDEDYYINALTYGDGEWAVAMVQGAKYTGQTWVTDPNYPAAWIKEQWDEGYYITSMAYGDGEWAVVMSSGTGFEQQTITSEATYPKDWIKEKSNQGYYITTVATGGSKWVVSMAKGTNYSGQTWRMNGKTFPEDWVQKNSDGSIVTTGTPAVTTTPTTTPVVTTDAKIHLIVVANTLISDIGTSCMVDENSIVNEFESISEALKIPLKKTIIDDRNLTRDKVTAVLNSLSPGANDIVVFVYSGHGYRWSDQTSKYPNIDLRYSEYQAIENANNYNLSDIYGTITAKGARLNIVIGDCCNSDIGVSNRGGEASLASKSFTQGEIAKLRTLFLNTRGNLIAAAAKPYETSCGNSYDGGYFINSFIAALHKEASLLSNSNPTWNRIFDIAIENALYKTQNLRGCTPQNGIYYSTIK